MATESNKRSHYKRVIISERERHHAPMSIDDIEQFCRTARREGAKGDTTVRCLGVGSAGLAHGMAVDIYIEAQSEPDPPQPRVIPVPAEKPSRPGGPAGRYIGLAGDVPEPLDPVLPAQTVGRCGLALRTKRPVE